MPAIAPFARQLRLVALFAVCAGLAAVEPALPLLHPLFSDGAVLQRGKPLTVWGWTAPGAEATVALAGAGLTGGPVTVTAAADGRWQAVLGPFAAGGPCTLSVRSGAATAEARDVLMGEVWLCGGQSNMGRTVRRSAHGEAEVAAADWPRIRLITVPRANAGHPQAVFTGRWQAVTPASVGEFSAVGYYFGRDLHRALDVPVGLVGSNWGGTDAEDWVSAGALAAHADFAAPVAEFARLVSAVEAQTAATGRTYDQLLAAWYAANDPGSAAGPGWADAGLDDAAWTPLALPGRIAGAVAGIDDGYAGTIWLRCRVEVPAALAGKRAELALGRQRGIDTVFVNGRPVGTHEVPREITWRQRSIGLPAGTLVAGANLIALRLVEQSAPARFDAKDGELALVPAGAAPIPLTAWRARAGVALAAAPALPLRFDRTQMATSLHNGMIAPLLPFSLAGVLWYQGENNAGRGHQYRSLLPLLIADWRAGFAQADLPFLIVQLANFQKRLDRPAESSWAELREAQALVARTLPRTGLAVAIDIGEADDIHPANKQDVGRRLALAARAIAYGDAVEWSGPWYRAMAVEGDAIRLSFDHVGGGLVAGDGKPLTGFAIAGEDRRFVWADARIDGDCVVVSAPTVARPVAVRYAWADNPACNLANQAGLPAVPFRTDDWPGRSWPKP